MREIKFRAWDKNLEMMVFSLEQTDHIEYDTNPVNAINIMLNEDDYGFEFMQYIGLKDKNGVEIYEGDIVEAIDRKYDCEEDRESCVQRLKVTYLNGCFMFGNWNAQEFFNRFMYIEVTDNIYEMEGNYGEE